MLSGSADQGDRPLGLDENRVQAAADHGSWRAKLGRALDGHLPGRRDAHPQKSISRSSKTGYVDGHLGPRGSDFPCRTGRGAVEKAACQHGDRKTLPHFAALRRKIAQSESTPCQPVFLTSLLPISSTA
jgi:hypothetical protein